MTPYHCIDKDFNFIRDFLEDQLPKKFENIYSFPILIDNKFREEFKNRFPLLVPKDVICFIRPQGHHQKIHIDRISNCALNIPITDSKESYMHFYSGKFTTTFIESDIPTNSTHLLEWSNGPFEIAKVELSKPTLVTTNIPHNVTYNGKGIRTVLSIRFFNNPDFSEVKNLLCYS